MAAVPSKIVVITIIPSVIEQSSCGSYTLPNLSFETITRKQQGEEH
jgi:hypothetical protein